MVMSVSARRPGPDPTTPRPSAPERRAPRAPTRSLQRGDRGPDVDRLQRALTRTGFLSEKDRRTGPGSFGPRTEAALRHFQRDRHIVQDGRYGPQSQQALQKALDRGVQHGAHGEIPAWFEDSFDKKGPDRGRLELGDRGRAVKKLEQRLDRLGFDPGKVDGEFDLRTRRAVENFQRRAGLPRTGAVNGRTARRLDGPRAPAAPGSAGAQLDRFDRVPPKHDYKRVSFRGATMNRRTQEMLRRAETIMAERHGHRGFQFSLSQGSYNPGYSPSGGTHDRGGALDIRTAGRSRKQVDDMVRALREAGFAAWSRGRGHDSFAPHIHAIAIGDRELSPSAAGQVREYRAGGDGLVGSRPDPDRSLGRRIPRWAR
jgi:peptidoglycan hydrolase-like protein with peptidoglycan-binding domain